MGKVCGHEGIERYCVICLNEEVDRGYRTINQIEDVLTNHGVAITAPLSDAVLGVLLEGKHAQAFDWARLLLRRDSVQGREALKRMVAWYEENDSKADDMGHLRIVIDAQTALAETEET